VRLVEPGGGWALVLPDPAEAVTHVWAEGKDAATAADLVTHWAEVVESTVP
jgi:mannose-1-phosphate guanylyltransferase/phosphomannomutase